MPSNRELKRQIDELRQEIELIKLYQKSYEVSFRDIYEEIKFNRNLIEMLGKAVQKILDEK